MHCFNVGICFLLNFHQKNIILLFFHVLNYKNYCFLKVVLEIENVIGCRLCLIFIASREVEVFGRQSILQEIE